jgi:hypothetical protein
MHRNGNDVVEGVRIVGTVGDPRRLDIVGLLRR